jgi:hypothetical protein
MRGHSRVNHINICFKGGNLYKNLFFKKPLTPKGSNLLPRWSNAESSCWRHGPGAFAASNKKSNFACVLLMTQVSDVALGPLVFNMSVCVHVCMPQGLGCQILNICINCFWAINCMNLFYLQIKSNAKIRCVFFFFRSVKNKIESTSLITSFYGIFF